MNSLLRGAIAGALATVPMTMAMEIMHRSLPKYERYPLPPKEIITEIAQEIGVRQFLDQEDLNIATMISHFGYGAAMGALYDPLSTRTSVPPLSKGLAFGLLVWSGGYLGLLPALGILRPATQHPPRRNALMITAHLVYGLSLATLDEQLRRREPKDGASRSQALQRSADAERK